VDKAGWGLVIISGLWCGSPSSQVAVIATRCCQLFHYFWLFIYRGLAQAHHYPFDLICIASCGFCSTLGVLQRGEEGVLHLFQSEADFQSSNGAAVLSHFANFISRNRV
jgi:hypothetical protein